MLTKLYNDLFHATANWLTQESPPEESPPSDFDRLKHELRTGDVLLIEGSSRVSNIIRRMTQSPWTHAALYIGRADDIENEFLHRIVLEHQEKHGNKRLIVEGLLGKGMIISPLNSYRHHHIRVCRPIGISLVDAELVTSYAIKAVGQPYSVRKLLDLARFMLPWSILPKRWGSSLFTTPSGEPESGICSTLIAEAFTSVKFPILPFIKADKKSGVELYHRNPKIFAPKDFDYSPYFEIIKFPVFSHGEQIPYYRRMPWTEEEIMHQGHGVFVGPKKTKRKRRSLTAWLPRRKKKKLTQLSDMEI